MLASGHAPYYDELWANFSGLWDLLSVPSMEKVEDVEGETDTERRMSYSLLVEDSASEFVSSFLSTAGAGVSIYMHVVLAHIPTLCALYGPLNRFSGQGE